MLARINMVAASMTLAAVSAVVSIVAVVVALRVGGGIRDQLAVHKLSIVDRDGKARVIMGTIVDATGDDAGAYIQMLNNKAVPVAGVVTRQKGRDAASEPMIFLCDDNANGVVTLTAGEVVGTSRTPRLVMDGGIGDYAQIILGISTGDSVGSNVPSNVAVPALGDPFFLMLGPNHDVVMRAP